MTLRYFDSSALVKRYVREPGSDRVREWLRTGPAATSRVALAEVAAAAARRCREGDLSAASLERLLMQLERDFTRLAVVEVTDDVNRRVLRLVREHPLRGFDALHLASCQLLASGAPGAVEFVCCDRDLLRAAEACGLACLDPA